MATTTTAVDADAAFLADVRRIAGDVAAAHADAVDHDARFPVETLDALREAGALGAYAPVELGGAGVSFAALATACFELGRRCGASAMVFAMHQIQAVTIARHLEGAPAFEEHLRRVAAEQRLMASVTSEVGTGGDMGSSVGSVVAGEDGEVSFVKQAPTISYGAHADDLLTTLRRAPESEPGDQVLVLTRADQHGLEPKGTWDTLGMRGTCSPGYLVSATLPAAQVLPTPFAEVSAESMVPVSHVLWSHLWLGIATEAFDRARAFVRAAAKRKPGPPPPAAHKLSGVLADLSLLRAQVAQGLADYERAMDEPGREWLGTMAAALSFNNLKVASSEQAPRVCQNAMNVTGIMGFKNDSPFSVGRHLRDSMSGALMVANERIHATNASLLLIAKDV